MSRKILFIISLSTMILGCNSIRKTIHFPANHPASFSNSMPNISKSKNYMEQDDLENKSNDRLKNVKEMPEGSHHNEGSHH